MRKDIGINFAKLIFLSSLSRRSVGLSIRSVSAEQEQEEAEPILAHGTCTDPPPHETQRAEPAFTADARLP